jgi:hypothetical protein
LAADSEAPQRRDPPRQVGDDQRVRLEHAYGRELTLDAYRLSPDLVTQLLENNGFDVDARLVREPVAPERVPQAYLTAHLAV